jgi:ribose-phosphate pyrophosphokinase
MTFTDSIPITPELGSSRKIRIISIAPLLAEAIKRVYFEESVSSLFV